MLLETFVNSRQYMGTCYRAANWKDLGLTDGRGRQDRTPSKQEPPKHVLIYSLRPDCREVLTAPLELPRLLPTHAPVRWWTGSKRNSAVAG